MFGLDLQKRQLCSSAPAAGQANKTFLLAIIATDLDYETFLIQTKPERNNSNNIGNKERTYRQTKMHFVYTVSLFRGLMSK